jgi:hypothetical protein
MDSKINSLIIINVYYLYQQNYLFKPTCAISAYTTNVVSSNPVRGEVYSIQHYVIKFVSDLRQGGEFLRFPPPIKLTTTI